MSLNKSKDIKEMRKFDVDLEFGQAADKTVWRTAARRPMACGLWKGVPDLRLALHARRELLRDDVPDHVKALDLIVCGGAWGPADKWRCRCGTDEVGHSLALLLDMSHPWPV